VKEEDNTETEKRCHLLPSEEDKTTGHPKEETTRTDLKTEDLRKKIGKKRDLREEDQNGNSHIQRKDGRNLGREVSMTKRKESLKVTSKMSGNHLKNGSLNGIIEVERDIMKVEDLRVISKDHQDGDLLKMKRVKKIMK
jgi:hypothetical protein